MKIVHFAPFAPNASGMYEAARDMVIADYLAGHDVYLVDVGATTLQGKQIEAKPGQKDFRGGTEIVTATPNAALDADVIFMHTGVLDNWLVKCRAPLIFVMHGRPQACFNTEQEGRKVSYSLLAEVASWPRVEVMLSFWPYHRRFWQQIIPEDKLVVLNAPPVDTKRFCPEGPQYDFAGKFGKKADIVMADAWRDDIGTYEVISGCIEAAKWVDGLKFHLFSFQQPLPKCWDYIRSSLTKQDALGVVWGRKDKMEEVYRAADLIVSPQRIVTRSVGEPLCCNTPVLADEGNELATWTCNTRDPEAIAEAVENAISRMNDPDVDTRIEAAKHEMSLEKYNEEIAKVYERLT